jgi:hypothetical protein
MDGRKTRFGKRGVSFAATALALGIAAAGCGDDDSGLDPGGGTISGNVTSANTNGETSLDGLLVIVRGDRESTGTTDSLGQFLISNTPTGDIRVIFRRGGCEAGFALDAVTSRSTLILEDVATTCDAATVSRITETTEAVLRNDPGSALETLDTCVRVGDDDQRRNVRATGASIFDRSTPATFGDLEDNDRIEVQGLRAGVGPAGTLDASRITILERDVNDPCDDDPFN